MSFAVGSLGYPIDYSAKLPVTDWGSINQIAYEPGQFAEPPASPYMDFGVDTSNVFTKQSSPFLDYLNTFSDLLQGGADLFRAIKGLPPRFGPEREQRMAGDQFSQYIQDRSQAREASRQKSKTPGQETKSSLFSNDPAFNLSILRKALSTPDALRQLFGENIVSPPIDPSSLGSEMDTTPAKQWRPQTSPSQP